MSELQNQIKQRNKRELATLPTHVDPISEETKRKIRKMFEREKRTHGMRQYMHGTENILSLKKQLFESCGMVQINQHREEKQTQRTPIKYIVLPSVSAPLTLNNVELFLKKSEYKYDGDCPRVNHEVVIERNGIEFHFVDRITPKINKRDIISVVLIAEDWQFEDLPFRDPFECIDNCCCFYFKFPDSKTPYKDWMTKSVKTVTIKKDLKSNIIDSIKIFWSEIDMFLKRRMNR